MQIDKQYPSQTDPIVIQIGKQYHSQTDPIVIQTDKQYPSQTDSIDSHADWQTIPFSDWSYSHADWQTIPFSDWSSRYPWMSLSLADTTPNTLYFRSATVSRNTVLVLDRALQTFTAIDKVPEGPTPATIYSDWQGSEWTGPWKHLQHISEVPTHSPSTLSQTVWQLGCTTSEIVKTINWEAVCKLG